MKSADKYSRQYCEKHDQLFADFLKECPICAGERMKVEPSPKNHKPVIDKPKLVKRKKKKEYTTPKLFNF